MTSVKDLIIQEPKNHEQLEQMYCLRWQVLRKPWDQPKGSERDEKDTNQFKNTIPIIALINNQVVGTIRLHQNTKDEGQLRYLAIDKEFRKKGIGSELILYSEKISKRLGFQKLILNARKTAAQFFKKLGYEIVGEGPIIFGVIDHYVMIKYLT
ncbi:MAG: GNAT family N-acetyltransferase [Candidatus Lokiarchaeota archaeon]